MEKGRDITIEEIKEYVSYIRRMYEKLHDHFIEMDNKNNLLLQRIGQSMDSIREHLTQNQIGIANVYSEFNKSQESIKKERQMLEDKTLELTIKSYPMNTRIIIKIETNFGEIDYSLDYPPLSGKIGEFIQNCYNGLLDELYDKHEERGGSFLGEGKGWKEWIDENGRTIIHKEPLNSPRIEKLRKEMKNQEDNDREAEG